MNLFSKISSLKQSISQRQAQFDHKYYLVQQLGEGSFAAVYSCRVTKPQLGAENHGDLAVKVFDRKSQRGLRREYRNETKIMEKITPDEHCVRMLDSFESSRFCHIVMEKCSCSVQEAFLRSSKSDKCVSERDLAHVFRCMLSGVQHLHECGIVHRDIKPANLLLAEGDNLSNRPLVKVCDLGLAAMLPARRGLTEICGTAPYMAPEMLIKKMVYREEVDLWSCGVTAYLMLLGGFPYHTARNCPRQMKTAIAEGTVKPTFKANEGFPQPSDAATAFLRSLLTREPDLRAGCSRALSSTYIANSLVPTSLPLPSFGPTLSIAHDTTKDEPAAETPVVRNSQVEELSSDESTTCESGGVSSEELRSSEDDGNVYHSMPRRITSSSITRTLNTL